VITKQLSDHSSNSSRIRTLATVPPIAIISQQGKYNKGATFSHTFFHLEHIFKAKTYFCFQKWYLMRNWYDEKLKSYFMWQIWHA
jgi:hypothetical protein